MQEIGVAFAEQTAKNLDRIATVTPIWGGRLDGWLAPQLYDYACNKEGGRPLSLVAAEALMNVVGKGDTVILVDQFGCIPRLPFGETDGPLGVASLARAISFALEAMPVLVTGPRDIGVAARTTQAAGVNVLDYDLAVRCFGPVAGEITFPVLGEDASRDFAVTTLDKVAPKAVISVETIGPNRKGVRHWSSGLDAEVSEPLPRLDHLFTEARSRGILTVAVIDRGNEIGGWNVQEAAQVVTPYAVECKCPCGAGITCSVETDVVFPASMSNWGAYAISAMLAYLTLRPEAFQDDDTERRMLEASVMAGAIDGTFGKPVLAVDGVGLKGQQATVNLFRAIVDNALRGVLTSEQAAVGR